MHLKEREKIGTESERKGGDKEENYMRNNDNIINKGNNNYNHLLLHCNLTLPRLPSLELPLP